MSKVKIQGHASGTGILTVTAPNTNTDRTITLPDGDVTLGAATPSIDDNGNATAITINATENIGVGVTPESWEDNYSALQIGGEGCLAGHSSGSVYVAENVYRNGGNWKHINTGASTIYQAYDGNHVFKVEPSGSADANISWSTKATIDSDGLKFNGDTAAANALDDFEEGEWTPVLVGSSTAGSHTYSVQKGFYEKIGRQVTARGQIVVNQKNTIAGNITMSGLPFTQSNETGSYSAMYAGYGSAMSLTAGTSFAGYTNLGQTTVTLTLWDNTAGINPLTASNINNGLNIVFALTYMV